MLAFAYPDVARALHDADPAGLLPNSAVDHVATALTSTGGITIEVAHESACPLCFTKMNAAGARTCHILTCSGLVEATHVPLRCSKKKCKALNKVVWANFQADAKGTYTWLDGSVRPDVAMLSPSFGVTWQWHSQFSKRMLHHHASFLGESYVHAFEAHGLSHGHELIAAAWSKLQLLSRWPHLSQDPFPLSDSFSDIFSRCRDKYDLYVADAFRTAAPDTEVIVIDGNQKLTRRCCAEMFTEIQSVPGTNLKFVQDCSKTPKIKSSFCATHFKPCKRDCGVTIKKKRCLDSDPTKLLTCVPPTASITEWPLISWLRDQVHIQSKRHNDKKGSDLDSLQAADYVTCRTIKMKHRTNRRTGGWLLACSGDGRVLHAMEIYGGESLTQRAAFVALLKTRYPALHTILHDDSCHLRRFMDSWFADYPALRFPHMNYIVDKFHSKTHCDEWCQTNCSPRVPANQARISGHNSSACEILFSWFSGYKASFRHMGVQTSHFFVHELLLMKNSWMDAQRQPQ